MTKEAMFNEYIPFAYRVARIFCRKYYNIDKDNIRNTALIGLHKAVEKYNPSLNIKFETFAYKKIEGAILDDMRELDKISRISRQIAKKALAIMDRFQSEHGYNLDLKDVANKIGTNYTFLCQSLYAIQVSQAASLDEKILVKVRNNYKVMFVHELIEDQHSLDDFETIHKRMTAARLINSLEKRHRKFAILYFLRNYTLKEIGDMFKIRESMASRIKRQVVKELRENAKNYVGATNFTI